MESSGEELGMYNSQLSVVKTVDGAVYEKSLINSSGVSTLCKPSQLRALVVYSTSDQGIATDQS